MMNIEKLKPLVLEILDEYFSTKRVKRTPKAIEARNNNLEMRSKYFTRTDLARACKRSGETIRCCIDMGVIPEPDQLVGRKYLWSRVYFDEYVHKVRTHNFQNKPGFVLKMDFARMVNKPISNIDYLILRGVLPAPIKSGVHCYFPESQIKDMVAAVDNTRRAPRDGEYVTRAQVARFMGVTDLRRMILHGKIAPPKHKLGKFMYYLRSEIPGM